MIFECFLSFSTMLTHAFAGRNKQQARNMNNSTIFVFDILTGTLLNELLHNLFGLIQRPQNRRTSEKIDNRDLNILRIFFSFFLITELIAEQNKNL